MSGDVYIFAVAGDFCVAAGVRTIFCGRLSCIYGVFCAREVEVK